MGQEKIQSGDRRGDRVGQERRQSGTGEDTERDRRENRAGQERR